MAPMGAASPRSIMNVMSPLPVRTERLPGPSTVLVKVVF